MRTVKSDTKGRRAASSSLLDLNMAPMPSKQMMLLGPPDSAFALSLVRGNLRAGNSGSTSGARSLCCAKSQVTTDH